MLPVEIKRSARSRSIRLRLHENKIVVSGPTFVSEQALLAFADSKKKWIEKQLTQKQKREANYPLAWPEQLTPGACLPYLGKQYELVFNQLPEKPALHCQGDQFIFTHFTIFDSQAAQAKLLDFYFQEADKLATQWLAKYCPELGLWPNGLRFKYQKSLYGSLGTQNIIHLNWLLITAPEYVFEYVLVHELSHLRYRHHGPRFWEQVKKLMPDYEEAESWLSNWGRCLKEPTWRAREESNL